MRWVKRVLIFLATVFVLAGVYGFLTVRSSFPQINGRLEVDVLDDMVTVHRDSFGVPPHLRIDERRPLPCPGIRRGPGSLLPDGLLASHRFGKAVMIELWASGGQRPMLWERGKVEEAAANTLTLTPGGG